VTETEPKPGEPVLPESEAAPPDPTLGAEARPNFYKAGMACFLVSEAAFFSTLLMVYTIYLGTDAANTADPDQPTPAKVFELPLVMLSTFLLLSSSVTIHFAEKALREGKTAAFHGLWALTILLGTLFIACTGYEWYGLIHEHGLTIDRNMFGTTYYTLVGFHAFHVSLGILALTAVLFLAMRGKLPGHEPIAVTLVGWYWHFVDVVWILVFTIVYIAGR
jgi:cytochrome c oxidase subunit III